LDTVNETTQSETLKPEENFVQNWLLEAVNKFSESLTLKAVSDATQLDGLDEALLIRRLRELAKASQEGNASSRKSRASLFPDYEEFVPGSRWTSRRAGVLNP
jgi:hypothetical protein